MQNVTMQELNKIVGFALGPAPLNISLTALDPLGGNLCLVHFRHAELYIYLWGIGDLHRCRIGDSYSLAFPLRADLDDRNVLLHLEEDGVRIENDWLGAIPVFYNANARIASTRMADVLLNRTLHPEGLSHFFRFGYSVLTQTPFAEGQFMRYASILRISPRKIVATPKVDPVFDRLADTRPTKATEVLGRLRKYVRTVESVVPGHIVVPTSGGFDSRLLNAWVEDRARIRAFTYGISRTQSVSFEVSKARWVAARLGLQWETIPIGKFLSYIPIWHYLYGCATHLHGMYQLEFYHAIRQKLGAHPATLLSGIVGDVWSGKAQQPSVGQPHDLLRLSYNHGIAADASQLRQPVGTTDLLTTCFEEGQGHWHDERFRLIMSMRFKIMLLSYLLQSPEYLGFPGWTPFLNLPLVMDMLALPAEERQQRRWQMDFFAREGLDIEKKTRLIRKSNTLNYEAFHQCAPEPLHEKVLVEIVRPEYLNFVNSLFQPVRPFEDLQNRLYRYELPYRLLSKIGQRPPFLDRFYPYLVLKALEMSLS